MAAITLLRAYQHSFDTRPNLTLSLTGGTLNAVGDAVAQVTQGVMQKDQKDQNRPKFDVQRNMRFFCYGMAISPLMGRWNVFLERRFPLRAIGGSGKVSFKALSKRVAADQLIMAPIGLCLFIGGMGMMEARSPSQIADRFRDIYRTALIANWRVWPLAQLVNFRFMPLPYRVPFSQACGVFWTLYLSILNSEEDKRQDKGMQKMREIHAEYEDMKESERA
ncbi:hypothetical protein D9619_003338 [Psilocybe cf. subviscida]|uniref:Uncharacterized protein n=1 Tax=Psilocybe cf. subviscida TaxID=2480587 RepID=A0A8H5EU94_9AGAR|nr:hypothetical protein D9619_003338 [Psilocybe cf. subviscida]